MQHTDLGSLIELLIAILTVVNTVFLRYNHSQIKGIRQDRIDDNGFEKHDN